MVIVLDLKSNEIARFDSITDASFSTGVLRSNITSVMKGRAKTANSLIFVYEDDYNKDKDYSRRPGITLKKVGKFNKTGQLLEVFEGCVNAAKSVSGTSNNVCNVCNNHGGMKSYKGFVWKYLD